MLRSIAAPTRRRLSAGRLSARSVPSARPVRVALFAALFITVIAALAGCDGGGRPESAADTAATVKAPPVVYARELDPAMNAAIQKAREEIAVFDSTLRSPSSTQTGFGVKVGLSHAGGTEHVWLGTPQLTADSVTGTVEDQPLYAKNVARGSRITVGRDAISDWMYMESGTLRGGYTMRVLIDRLPEGQRAEQKKAFGIE